MGLVNPLYLIGKQVHDRLRQLQIGLAVKVEDCLILIRLIKKLMRWNHFYDFVFQLKFFLLVKSHDGSFL
jgi:hypothetical protein